MDVYSEREHEYLTGVDEMYDDDDGGYWTVTDIECPFCRHLIEWKFTELRCDNCELTWANKQEVDADRVEPHDEMGDADLFNRGMRVGTAGWAWGMR